MIGEHSATFEPATQMTSVPTMSDQGLVVAVDAERLLVRGAGADHAEPAVVVDERRLQADARELAEQIGLLGRQARAAEHADRAGAVRRCWTRAISAATRAIASAYGMRAEAARRRRIAREAR